MSQELRAALDALRASLPAPHCLELVLARTRSITLWSMSPSPVQHSAYERAIATMAQVHETTRDQTLLWASGVPTTHPLHVRHGHLSTRRWLLWSPCPISPRDLNLHGDTLRAFVLAMDSWGSRSRPKLPDDLEAWLAPVVRVV